MTDVSTPEPAASVGPWSASARAVLAVAAMAAGLAVALLAPSRRATPARPPSLVLDLNEAPAEVLSALPGVGPALTAEIEARRAEAPFRDLPDLARRARGVGPATLARLSPYLRVDPRLAARDR